MRRGLFISFEGTEGSGKSTQVARLTAKLRALGFAAENTREPGGTAIGEAIRHLLKHSSEGEKLFPEAELLLFAASRAQLTRELICPALERGVTVVADRFLDSSTAYQGLARGIETQQVEAINRFAVEKCMPNITFLLDLSPDLAEHRLKQRSDGEKDRMESESFDFFQTVRIAYIELANNQPERFHVIDATKPADTIEQEIWNYLTKKFHGFFLAERI